MTVSPSQPMMMSADRARVRQARFSAPDLRCVLPQVSITVTGNRRAMATVSSVQLSQAMTISSRARSWASSASMTDAMLSCSL